MRGGGATHGLGDDHARVERRLRGDADLEDRTGGGLGTLDHIGRPELLPDGGSIRLAAGLRRRYGDANGADRIEPVDVIHIRVRSDIDLEDAPNRVRSAGIEHVWDK